MANGGRAGYMGRPKYFTIYYRSTRSTRSLQENMRICQGNLREFSGTNCPTFIAMNQLAVKITRRSLSFGCICINSSTCSPMALKWFTKLNVVLKRCPIVFHGHPSNSRSQGTKKSPICTQIGGFRTVTPVWIQWWLWNDAQSLKQHRRGALLFFKVIHQIWRSSHGTKIGNFDPNWPFRTVTQVDGFEMMHKAWRSIEEL